MSRRSIAAALRVLALVLVLPPLLLSGCTETPKVRAGAPTLSTAPSAPTSPSAPADLGDRKQAAGIAACPTSAADGAPVADGLPDLMLDCLGGGRQVRLAGLQGPLVMNVWAQWCGPCRTEAPYLATVSTAAAKLTEPVTFLGIDYADPDAALAIDFAGAAAWRYPQLADPDKATTAALRLAAGPPQTIFVAADGTITFVHVGPFTSEAQLRDAMTEHLGTRW